MLAHYLRVARRALQIRRDPVAYARQLGVGVGERCRLIDITAQTFGSEPFLISIGSHVTLTSGVRFVTHDGGVWVLRDEFPEIDVFAPIRIGSNVFVGVNSLLLPGATIGDDCIIGAGSIVRGTIPSGSVAAGVPARRIRSIDEYRQRALDQAFNIRSLSRVEKRRLLLEKFSEPE